MTEDDTMTTIEQIRSLGMDELADSFSEVYAKVRSLKPYPVELRCIDRSLEDLKSELFQHYNQMKQDDNHSGCTFLLDGSESIVQTITDMYTAKRGKTIKILEKLCGVRPYQRLEQLLVVLAKLSLINSYSSFFYSVIDPVIEREARVKSEYLKTLEEREKSD